MASTARAVGPVTGESDRQVRASTGGNAGSRRGRQAGWGGEGASQVKAPWASATRAQ